MWIQFDDEKLKGWSAGTLDDAAMLAYLRERFEHYRDLEQNPNAAKYLAAAQLQIHEGELEFDDDAVVSMGDDPGAYVMGWLWIANEEAGIPEEEDGEEFTCTCSDRSWYGVYHDSVCPFAGKTRVEPLPAPEAARK